MMLVAEPIANEPTSGVGMRVWMRPTGVVWKLRCDSRDGALRLREEFAKADADCSAPVPMGDCFVVFAAFDTRQEESVARRIVESIDGAMVMFDPA